MDTEAANGANNRNKTRKKKNFLQNAKGYGRKGHFGSGQQVSQEQYNYLISILESLRNDDLDEENLTILATNVFRQCEGNELDLSCNQVGSLVLDKILGYTEPDVYEKFANLIFENIRIVCSDKFASFLLQSLVEISFLRCAREEESEEPEPQSKRFKRNNDEVDVIKYSLRQNFSNEHKEFCAKYVERVSKFLLNNLEDYVFDYAGNHIIRKCITSLSGSAHKKQKSIGTGKFSKNNNEPIEIITLIVPSEWFDIVREYAVRLQSWPQFPDFPYNELTSTLVQTLLDSFTVIDKKLISIYGKHLLKESFCQISDEQPNVLKVFSTESSVRLLESFILVASEKLIMKIYKKLYVSHISELSLNRNTNFTVQKLLNAIKDKEMFSSIFDEISPNFQKLLQIGHTGVIVAIAKACQTLCAKQGQFVHLIKEALNCSEKNSEKFLICILKLKPFEMIKSDENDFIHLHGSVIVQTMLNFNKPFKLVENFMNMNNGEISKIFCHSKGSYIGEAFLQSKFINIKTKEKFMQHMSGEFTKLAVSRFGSRCVEAFYEAISKKYKEYIIEELSNSLNQLNSTPAGRIINSKYKVELYKRNKKNWVTWSTDGYADKTQKLFKDIC